MKKSTNKASSKKKKQQNEPNPKTKEIKDNGRPPFTPDEGPRKKRVETPKSTPGLADLIVWSNDAFENISTTLNKAFLGANNKKNLRQLTKAEVCNLEDLKIQVLSNLELMSTTDEDSILKALSSKAKIPKTLRIKLISEKISASEMPINTYKKKIIGAFVEHYFDNS